MNQIENRTKREKGFTLVELLIVMVILGLLGALVGPELWKKIAGAKRKAAFTQIHEFGTTLDLYRLDVGKYPTTDQGLEVLRTNQGDVSKWDGPYLKKEVPKDPWSNAYEYKSPGENGDYDLISYGRDGAPGGEGEDADVVSWKGLD